jgi:hypothetical protein
MKIGIYKRSLCNCDEPSKDTATNMVFVKAELVHSWISVGHLFLNQRTNFNCPAFTNP